MATPCSNNSYASLIPTNPIASCVSFGTITELPAVHTWNYRKGFTGWKDVVTQRAHVLPYGEAWRPWFSTESALMAGEDFSDHYMEAANPLRFFSIASVSIQ